METKTKISNMAYMIQNNIGTNEFKDIEFELNVLEKAIKDYKNKVKQNGK